MSLTGLIDALILPPGGPIITGLLGILLRRRGRRRLGTACMGIGIVLAYIFSIPLTADALNRALQRYEPLTDQALAEHRPGAIVVLAGGIDTDAPEYGGETVNLRTLGRLRYAARLARRTGLPVLVSGGFKDEKGQATEAELMQQALQEDFGINAVISESASRNTWQNALNSAEILKKQGEDTIILVTHAAHMPRATAAFERSGLKVIPAPTLFFGREIHPLDPWSWTPQVRDSYEIHYALHEWLGRLWYWLSNISL